MHLDGGTSLHCAFKFCLKSMYLYFDQTYSKMYQHSQCEINIFILIIKCSFYTHHNRYCRYWYFYYKFGQKLCKRLTEVKRTRGSIMHTGILANMLMWQSIKEERGVRVTSVHACIGKHIFLWRTTTLVEYFCRLQKLFHRLYYLAKSRWNFWIEPFKLEGR